MEMTLEPKLPDFQAHTPCRPSPRYPSSHKLFWKCLFLSRHHSSLPSPSLANPDGALAHAGNTWLAHSLAA